MSRSERLLDLLQRLRRHRRLLIRYRDAGGQDSQRTVWPFALGYFDQARVLVAWCELRQQVRHFRTDRISALSPLATHYPQRRQALLKAWRAHEGMAETPR